MRVRPRSQPRALGARAAGLRRAEGGLVLTTLLAGALLALATVLVGGVLVLALAAAWYWHDLPPLDEVTHYQPRQHLQVLTAEGDEIAGFGSERRIFVPVAKFPKPLVDAVLAIEDTQFYDHFGISFKGLVRAALANLTPGGLPQGASTITQQVARTFFLSTRRTPERKIKEALLALQIERRLSKDQILELYLNQIYLGQRAYGFGAAAQAYFGKPLAALSLAESAMLAGLPQNPMWANPVSNPERARRRQLLVLDRMQKIGRISAEQHAQAVAEKLVLRSVRVNTLHAEYVAEMARQAVVARFGEDAYTQGVQVHTSIRTAEQRAAYAALRRALIAHERKQPWRGPEDHETLPSALSGPELERAAAQALKDHHDDDDLRLGVVLDASAQRVRVQLASGETVDVTGSGLRQALPGLRAGAPDSLALRRGSIVRVLAEPAPVRAGAAGGSLVWQLTQWPAAEGGYVSLDPANGRVRSLVGGFDFSKNQFNHVTSAWRQPGSSFKPFLYSAALAEDVAPATLVDDLPLTREEGATDAWQPKNADGRFDGSITVREALTRSKNMVSLRLLRHLGLERARSWMARFGFDMAARHPNNLTLALGSGSVTPLQMAAAYGVFANGGWLVDPVLIERIVDGRGRVVFQAPTPERRADARAVPEDNLFLMRSLLADVTSRGTAAQAAARLGRTDVFGKTGTTDDAVDAWFAGFGPGVVGVAWVGYDEPRSLGERESGGGLALPVWIDAMRVALKGVAPQPLQPVAGVERRGDDWAISGRPVVAVIAAPSADASAGAATGAAPEGGAGVAPGGAAPNTPTSPIVTTGPQASHGPHGNLGPGAPPAPQGMPGAAGTGGTTGAPAPAPGQAPRTPRAPPSVGPNDGPALR